MSNRMSRFRGFSIEAFVIRICFEFRVSNFGICSTGTFRRSIIPSLVTNHLSFFRLTGFARFHNECPLTRAEGWSELWVGKGLRPQPYLVQNIRHADERRHAEWERVHVIKAGDARDRIFLAGGRAQDTARAHRSDRGRCGTGCGFRLVCTSDRFHSGTALDVPWCDSWGWPGSDPNAKVGSGSYADAVTHIQ